MAHGAAERWQIPGVQGLPGARWQILAQATHSQYGGTKDRKGSRESQRSEGQSSEGKKAIDWEEAIDREEAMDRQRLVTAAVMLQSTRACRALN